MKSEDCEEKNYITYGECLRREPASRRLGQQLGVRVENPVDSTQGREQVSPKSEGMTVMCRGGHNGMCPSRRAPLRRVPGRQGPRPSPALCLLGFQSVFPQFIMRT